MSSFSCEDDLKGMDTPLDVGDILSTTSGTGGLVVLNLIRQGVNSWQRVGRFVYPASVRLYGTFNLTFKPLLNGIHANKIRMVVLWDKQPSGSLPGFNTVFGHTVESGTESTFYLDPIRYDLMDRFDILCDKTFVMQPPFSLASGDSFPEGHVYRSFDETIDLRGYRTNYSGQSSPMAITDIDSGALYVWFRGDTNVTTSKQTVLASSVGRLLYSD